MTPFQAMLIALKAIGASRLRSFLTILGIVIGVSSFVTMVAVGSGAQSQIADQIRSLGANVLVVSPAPARHEGARMRVGENSTLTEGDAAAIATQLSSVRAAAPSVAGNVQIVRGSKNWNTTANGTTAAHFLVREWKLEKGRLFTYSEEREAAKTLVLGSIPARELFGAEDPVGAQVRVLNVPFTVAGVLESRGQQQDDVVFVPLSTARMRFMGAGAGARGVIGYILARAMSDEEMQAATDQIQALLRQRHRLPADREDDFRIVNPAAVMEAQQGATRTVAWLLAALASVSLLVGGISIMNIMIVSVVERTREIGIRRALGARMRDIRRQFLYEAIVLSTIGGAVGALSGVIAALAITRFAGWPVHFSFSAIVLAIAFAGVTGLFFGLYPAHKAASLSPVEALRTE